MTINDVAKWQHEHSFGQENKRPGETRTVIVVLVTAITMVVEITAGVLFGSMALLADGLHMASHASALSIALFAYIYARRHAFDRRFNFGTGKVNSLAGFSGALLLAGFALIMAWESISRLLAPVEIQFDYALIVAVIGLIVNGISMVILGHGDHGPVHHDHSNAHAEHEEHSHGHKHHDHNLRSAYLHVLADTLTSIFAIVALLAGKYAGLVWLDPVMGIVGACLVGRWSFGLLLDTSAVLLDHQASEPIREVIREAIERHDAHRVVDLHVWAIGPGINAAIITIVADSPKQPNDYRRMIPADTNVVHATIEIRNATT